MILSAAQAATSTSLTVYKSKNQLRKILNTFLYLACTPAFPPSAYPAVWSALSKGTKEMAAGGDEGTSLLWGCRP